MVNDTTYLKKHGWDRSPRRKNLWEHPTIGCYVTQQWALQIQRAWDALQREEPKCEA
jgi:hypothetical protein